MKPKIEVIMDVINENKRPNLTAESKFVFKYFCDINNRKVNKKAPIGKCKITG
jgi:hypothetical protein